MYRTAVCGPMSIKKKNMLWAHLRKGAFMTAIKIKHFSCSIQSLCLHCYDSSSSNIADGRVQIADARG